MTDGRALEGWSVLELAVELARRGEQFVLATVVWREGPSSGQHGSRAILTASGDIHGWIGGACAEPVFVREALRALDEGKPRLLALGAVERFGDLPQGTEAIAMSCQSEGALQIYIEPVLAVPHLVIVGDSPMARTLASLARQLDWNVDRVEGSSSLGASAVGERSLVVVATQGHGDEDVLEKVLAASPAYVGVVASRKRGATLLEYLADRGALPEALARIRIPAGIDLGHTTHKEVAVAVLAELVQLRAAGEVSAAPVSTVPEIAEAVDPICGMTVTADENSHPLEIDGVIHYFCCPGCRATFAKQDAGAGT